MADSLARWVGALCLLSLLGGCQALYRYRPVAVQAVDAETGRPIVGAEVSVTYPLTPTAVTPVASGAPTGADGVARLRAAPCGDTGPKVRASAANYLPEEKFLSVETLEALPAAGLFDEKKAGPLSVVLKMYAGPAPTVELVLPTGYRGLVRAEIQLSDEPWGSPGQRQFRYDVADSGLVKVTGPRLLSRIIPAAYQARYADGTLLSVAAQGDEVGFWWLSHEGGYEYFLVGTRRQYDARHPEEHRSPESVRQAGESDGRHGGNGGSPAPTR